MGNLIWVQELREEKKAKVRPGRKNSESKGKKKHEKRNY
jgi:hypothetical protein